MRATRFAVTLVFLADGVMIGSWAARIPAVQHHAGLTNAQLGAALFAMSLGAVAAMPLAGWAGGRVGSRTVVTAALLGAAASLFATSLATGLAALAVALAFFGASFGAVNVSANVQGIALERLYGRPILSSFHAAFSGGGLLGAGLGAVAAAVGLSARGHLGAVGLVLGVAALLLAPRLLETEREEAPARTFARPPRPLLVLGAAAFFTLLAEGAAADWSAVYLSHSLGATAAVAALGYTGFSLAMATSRTVGDRLNARFGPVALARGGGLLAAGGLGVGLISGSAPAAIVGFLAMGAGLGVVVPVLFRAAGSTPGVSAGIGVASVSVIGWLGFLSGPPAIGVAAGAVGLRAALVIVVVAALLLALLARSARPRDRIALDGLEPRAVLSDLDGVLVDSLAQIETTWRAFAERHGLDAEAVLGHIHGRRAIDSIRALAPDADVGEELARLEQHEVELAPGLRSLPGAVELVAHVPADRFAIVTSGSRRLALARLEAAGLPVPKVLVSADEVDAGKPDPRGYLQAAAALGVDPADAVVLEDAPAGVAAGIAAGMTVVAVLTTSGEGSLEAAHRRVPDLSALLPSSPRGRDVVAEPLPAAC
jgi:HAD superfamily hydrolase (TIGR01509 family)